MLSRISYTLCAALMLYACLFHYPRWKAPGLENTLGWDVSTYYWYLPATFIYKDLKQQKFGDSIVREYAVTPYFSQSYEHSSGNRVIMYSAGMAVMYLPFFAIAHAVAEPFGYPADGFSMPYALAISLGSLLVALAGLWYFRKLLLLYFDDKVAAIVLAILVAGTNYLGMSTINGPLTHNWLFTIYVLLLLNTHHFHHNPRYKYAIRIGVLTGLAILTRPSEIIALLIPLLWGIDRLSAAAVKTKVRFLLQHRSMVLAAMTCATAIGCIQVVYWLYVTGQPFVYSYRDQGFSWLSPHFKNYLFSYHSGWLLYTPVMIIVLLSFIPFVWRGRNRVAILAFSLLNIYIVSSWDVWQYGGRAMVQSYPVLLIPFAGFVNSVIRSRPLIVLLSPIVALLVYFNLWVAWQAYGPGGLNIGEGMNKNYFWRIAGRWTVHEDVLKLKDTDEIFEGIPRNKALIYQNDLSVVVGADHEWGPEMSFNYSPGKHRWIRAQARFTQHSREWEPWRMTQFTLQFVRNGEVIKSRMVRVQRLLLDRQPKDIYLDVKVPTEPFDRIAIVLWNPGSSRQLVADNIRIWGFDE